MSWSAAIGGSRCSEVACETCLCRTWSGTAVYSSTDGFSAGVAVRSRVQFDVSGKYEDEGDDCRKGFPPKRKNCSGSSSPGPVRRAEPVVCVPERLHLFPWEEGCRGRHAEAAIVTPLAVVISGGMHKVLFRHWQSSSVVCLIDLTCMLECF